MNSGHFEFATAGRIIVGPGRLTAALSLVPTLGRRALIVTGAHRERAEPLLAQLRELEVASTCISISGEPSVETAIHGTALGREFAADIVVGFGGGSALDAAKAIAALIANRGDPLDYLEVVGRGMPLEKPALPCVAIPTTSGTGSEVTKNAVLASEQHKVKVSLRDASMLPRLAIVDSELTLSVPPDVTAATGLDALTQCIEPYISCLSNPLTDGIALEGIRLGARNLPRAFANGNDREARAGMALTSLFGGLALANSKLGAVHGLAGPLGGMCHAPHGAICARLLPLVFDANLVALQQRDLHDPALERMTRVAQLLTGDVTARPEAGTVWLQELVLKLGIRGLAHYGLSRAELPELVTKAQSASSMQGNPVRLSPAELSRIAERALEDPSQG
jgi:alcohol dehydrogenase class IV